MGSLQLSLPNGKDKPDSWGGEVVKGQDRCLGGKVLCPKFDTFPSFLYSISPLSSQGEGMQESQVVWGVLQCKRKCPLPRPFALTPLQQHPVAHRDARPCTEARSCATAGCLPVPLHRCSASPLLEEGTAPAWEGCPPAYEQQRNGLCSPKSTEGAHEPYLPHKDLGELLSHSMGPLSAWETETQSSPMVKPSVSINASPGRRRLNPGWGSLCRGSSSSFLHL